MWILHLPLIENRHTTKTPHKAGTVENEQRRWSFLCVLPGFSRLPSVHVTVIPEHLIPDAVLHSTQGPGLLVETTILRTVTYYPIRLNTGYTAD